MKLVAGATRTVLLTRKYALKFPRFYDPKKKLEWRSFWYGFLANLQERYWWNHKGPSWNLCPILLSDPIGILVVMPRCQPIPYNLSEYEYRKIFPHGLRLLDKKKTNFGILSDKVVITDYGTKIKGFL